MQNLSLVNNRLKYASKRGYSIENGYTARRRSLIEDAKFDSICLRDSSLDEVLIDEEIPQKPIEIKYKLVVTTINNNMINVIESLNIIKDENATLDHIASRPSRKLNKSSIDIYLQFTCSTISFSRIMVKLKALKSIKDIVCLNAKNGYMLSREASLAERTVNIWIPISIWDLDKCTHLDIKYEPEIDSRHPGFSDVLYRQRRQHIADIAFEYRQ